MTELTCIVCPLGCRMTVERVSGGEISISGNSCPRGKKFAITEVTAPTRTLTAAVSVEGRRKMLSVKTLGPIPKEKMLPAMKEIKKILVLPPVEMGQIIMPNIAGTGVALVTTKKCE